VHQVRLVRLSPSGKTCTFDTISMDKGYQRTYYFAKTDTRRITQFERIRVSTLVANFYEMK
jgi:hypothetical protein